jgi:hypothetical protein
MVKVVKEKELHCSKCSGRMLVDRVFLSYDHLEVYCLICGKREMYNHPERFGEVPRWIMKVEKARVRITGNTL